jgi:hypothetical protein
MRTRLPHIKQIKNKKKKKTYEAQFSTSPLLKNKIRKEIILKNEK